MGLATCGCLAEELLDRQSNSASKTQGTKEAARARDRWGCSGRESDALPRNTNHLGPDQLAALQSVNHLTGFGAECTTCPIKYAALPWVDRAVCAYEFHVKGETEAVEPNPLPILIEAIRLVGRGVAEAKAEAEKRHTAEMKRLYPPPQR